MKQAVQVEPSPAPDSEPGLVRFEKVPSLEHVSDFGFEAGRSHLLGCLRQVDNGSRVEGGAVLQCPASIYHKPTYCSSWALAVAYTSERTVSLPAGREVEVLSRGDVS